MILSAYPQRHMRRWEKNALTNEHQLHYPVVGGADRGRAVEGLANLAYKGDRYCRSVALWTGSCDLGKEVVGELWRLCALQPLVCLACFWHSSWSGAAGHGV